MTCKHLPRIIAEDTNTYKKGTVVCSKCGLALQFPTQQNKPKEM